MSLIEAAKALLALERSIALDLLDTHADRGDAASEWMREDDCDLRREFRERCEALRLALTEAPALPGREEIGRDGELIDSVLRWACEPTPGDPTLAECIAALDALERIIALALQPRAEEWRPISEAPRDGVFLAATADGRMMIWRADLLRTAMAQSTPDHLTFPATHFRPLPPPPKPEVEG